MEAKKTEEIKYMYIDEIIQRDRQIAQLREELKMEKDKINKINEIVDQLTLKNSINMKYADDLKARIEVLFNHKRGLIKELIEIKELNTVLQKRCETEKSYYIQRITEQGVTIAGLCGTLDQLIKRSGHLIRCDKDLCCFITEDDDDDMTSCITCDKVVFCKEHKLECLTYSVDERGYVCKNCTERFKSWLE